MRNILQEVANKGREFKERIKLGVSELEIFKRREDYRQLEAQTDEIAGLLKDPRYENLEKFMKEYRNMLIEGIKLFMLEDNLKALAYSERLRFIDDLMERPGKLAEEFRSLKEMLPECGGEE